MIRTLVLAAALGVVAAPAAAQAPPSPVTTPIRTLEATSSGQPILMPSGPLRVTLSETVIPPHGRLAAHQHPYPRYVYVAAGRLRVTNLVTGQVQELKAGDLTVDPIGQWHEAEALGETPVRLLALDQAPPNAPTSIPRAP